MRNIYLEYFKFKFIWVILQVKTVVLYFIGQGHDNHVIQICIIDKVETKSSSFHLLGTVPKAFDKSNRMR